MSLLPFEYGKGPAGMGTSSDPFLFILGGQNKSQRSEGMLSLPIREQQKLTRDKVVQHMEKNIWVVTKSWGDNYYNVQKGSTLVLDFDFNTGQLSPTGNYSNDNPTRHFRVFNTTGVSLGVGDQCLLGYRGQDIKQKPFIKSVYRRPFGQQTSVALVPIALALWSPDTGTPFLSRSVPSSVVHPFSGVTNDLWIGTSVTQAVPFGPVVLASERIVVAQGIRDSGDTFWERIRLSIQTPFGAVEQHETTMSVSPSFWYTTLHTNSDGSLVFVVDIANRQIWRKRREIFEQITLTDLSSFDFVVISVSPLGYIMLPEYGRTASQTYTVTAPYTNPAATTINNGVSIPTGSDKCRAWNADILASTIARAWEFDPASQLQSEQPVVNSLGFGATGNGHAVCSIYGDTFVTWASGRPRLPATTPYNQASLVRFVTPPSNVPTGYSTAISKSVEGVLMGVSAVTGQATWTHRITVTAADPSDYGLLTPLDNFISATYTTTMGAHHTYFGIASMNALTANVPGGYSSTILSDSYFPGFDISWSGPDYAVFFDAAIVMLPRDEANTTRPREIGSVPNLNNMAVFTDYIQPGTLETIDQTLGVVGDHEGNYYFAYLEPVGLKVAGKAGEGMGISNGCWGSFAGSVTIDPFVFPITRGGYLIPDVVNVYRRKLRKISNTGALVLQYDLTQSLTASWYELESSLWTGFPGTAVGGDSNSGIPLADNIWKIVPCGRVVFLIIDYHVLGPNYMPATQLQILDANSATILHTLYLTNDLGFSTLPSNIYGTDSTTEYFEGDDVVDTFTLTEPPLSVISVLVDGSSVPYTLSGSDIIFSSPPGMGLEVAIEYEYSDTMDIIYRAGERRYAADPLTCDLRAGFSEEGLEWAAVDVTRIDRSGATAASEKTFLVEIQALMEDSPGLTIGNATGAGAGRSVISKGTILQPVFDSQWRIRQTV